MPIHRVPAFGDEWAYGNSRLFYLRSLTGPQMMLTASFWSLHAPFVPCCVLRLPPLSSLAPLAAQPQTLALPAQPQSIKPQPVVAQPLVAQPVVAFFRILNTFPLSKQPVSLSTSTSTTTYLRATRRQAKSPEARPTSRCKRSTNSSTRPTTSRLLSRPPTRCSLSPLRRVRSHWPQGNEVRSSSPRLATSPNQPSLPNTR